MTAPPKSTAKVTDTEVDKAAKLGKFPAVDPSKLRRILRLITLEDGVLFDFGKSEIRSDASQTLKKLADVLNNAKVPRRPHLRSHRLHLGRSLQPSSSPRNARAPLSGERKKDSVTATMDATGHGESKPVAPQRNADGSDNPAGRGITTPRRNRWLPRFLVP